MTDGPEPLRSGSGDPSARGDGSGPDDAGASIPDVVVRRRSGFSIVWLIPMVAALVAGWIWMQALQEQGPVISITFETAAGLEAGKTKVKHREVEIGVVEEIALLPDLKAVRVTVQLVPEAEPYLTEQTRFWVVRPRIGAGGVSGLGTLLSGAYIEVNPSLAGAAATQFAGLELPPLRPADAPGLRLTLESSRLGSLSIGSPVLFRDLEIGQVERLRLTADAQAAEIDLYVEARHAHLIRTGTRFWNASGVKASLGAEGIGFSAESLDTLLRGGIDCDTPAGDEAGARVSSGHRFPLYANFESSREVFAVSEECVMYFDGSVRGLLPGAPVEWRGIKIGEVTGVSMVFSQDTEAIRIPVRAEIQPERFSHEGADDLDSRQSLAVLVARGLRAQLATGSLLTGALYVDLDFHPGSSLKLHGEGDLLEVPTIPSTVAQIQATLLELPEMVDDLRIAIAGVRELVESTQVRDALSGLEQTLSAGPGVMASVQDTLRSIDDTLDSLKATVGDDSEIRYGTVQALSELRDTLRSVRSFVDYLERHPEALITGKENP